MDVLFYIFSFAVGLAVGWVAAKAVAEDKPRED